MSWKMKIDELRRLERLQRKTDNQITPDLLHVGRPAKDKEIEKIQKKYPFAPDSYLDFLRMAQGMEIWVMHICCITETTNHYHTHAKLEKEIKSEVGNQFPKKEYLPIGEVMASVGFFIRPDGKVIVQSYRSPNEDVSLIVDSFDEFLDHHVLGEKYEFLYDLGQINRDKNGRENAARQKEEAEAEGREYVDRYSAIKAEDEKYRKEEPQWWQFFATPDWKKLEEASNDDYIPPPPPINIPDCTIHSVSSKSLYSKSGGSPQVPNSFKWPNCKECNKPMKFLFQVDLKKAGVDRNFSQGKALLVFQCESGDCTCDSWDAESGSNIALIINIEETTEVIAPKGETILSKEHRLSFKKVQEYDEFGEAYQEAREMPKSKIVGRMGEIPFWVQSEETPTCRCGKEMVFVLQIEENAGGGINFGGQGTGFAFVCSACRDKAKFLWQC